MLDTIIAAAIVIAILAVHGLAMFWLWRRMRRTNLPRPERRQHFAERPNHEDAAACGRLYRGQRLEVNEGLIDQGAASREGRWPIN